MRCGSGCPLDDRQWPRPPSRIPRCAARVRGAAARERRRRKQFVASTNDARRTVDPLCRYNGAGGLPVRRSGCDGSGSGGRCAQSGLGRAGQGRSPGRRHCGRPARSTAVLRQADRAVAELRGAGGDRDGERAAGHRNARGVGAADRNRRSPPGHQFVARRPCSNLRRDLRKGAHSMRQRPWIAIFARRRSFPAGCDARRAGGARRALAARRIGLGRAAERAAAPGRTFCTHHRPDRF